MEANLKPTAWGIAGYVLEIILMIGFLALCVACENYISKNRKVEYNPRRTHTAGMVK